MNLTIAFGGTRNASEPTTNDPFRALVFAREASLICSVSAPAAAILVRTYLGFGKRVEGLVMTISDERAIKTVVDRWMAATKAGDLDAVLKLMSEDAIFTVPEREPFGKEQFAKGFEEMAKMNFSGESEILEIEVFGDYAWTRNRIRIAIKKPGGETIERQARTLTIYKREADGEWRLFRDANLPA
jgi:uncharacterized protein (TIGR02246 family)